MGKYFFIEECKQNDKIENLKTSNEIKDLSLKAAKIATVKLGGNFILSNKI